MSDIDRLVQSAKTAAYAECIGILSEEALLEDCPDTNQTVVRSIIRIREKMLRANDKPRLRPKNTRNKLA